MDNSSYFIKNRSLFGSFPTQESVEELENHGVRYFVDLTDIDKEKKISAYKTKYTYINYKINDHSIPTDLLSFSCLIIKISKIIKNLTPEQRVYIHCKGGHGRSGVVVACILCHIFNLSPQDSLIYTTKCHSRRKNMKERWRQLGSPQNYYQKRFVYKFFENINICDTDENIEKLCFFSNHPIKTETETYNNVYKAYSKYIEKYSFGDENIDDKIKIKIMSTILKMKLNKYPEIHNIVMNTGLKRLIYISKEDIFWGNGSTNTGKNYLGKIWMKIRNEYYEQHSRSNN